jgi:hypothetical protein
MQNLNTEIIYQVSNINFGDNVEDSNTFIHSIFVASFFSLVVTQGFTPARQTVCHSISSPTVVSSVGISECGGSVWHWSSILTSSYVMFHIAEVGMLQATFPSSL